MTKLFTTIGFVIGRRDHKESDRVYTFFSYDLGKIDIRARSASKTTAKLSPHMESASCVNAFVVDGKGGYTLAGADIEEPFFLEDWKLSLYLAGTQLISLGTKWNHEEPHLFTQFLEWVRYFSSLEKISAIRQKLILGSFALRVVSHCGYKPELFNCLSCDDRVRPDSFMWSSSKGGVICKTCFSNHEESWMKIQELNLDVLKLLRVASNGDWDDLAKIEIIPEILESFLEVIDSLILAHFPVIPSVSVSHIIQVDDMGSF